MKIINIIGAAWGLAAGNTGCSDGPKVFHQSLIFKKLSKKLPVKWLATIASDINDSNDKTTQVAKLNKTLALEVAKLVDKQQIFCVIGGDHSCAIGTWSGVAKALPDKKLGLIWIDAHLDAHTFETTESGNIHGMPVAALLGHGDRRLTEILEKKTKILPENLIYIGIRSFEKGELGFVKELGIKIIDMNLMNQLGLKRVFDHIGEVFLTQIDYFGVTIDLDAFDPKDAPGVGSPEPNGISAIDFLEAIKGFGVHEKFIGMEITEFNPHQDLSQKTEYLISDLLLNFFQKRD